MNLQITDQHGSPFGSLWNPYNVNQKRPIVYFT